MTISYSGNLSSSEVRALQSRTAYGELKVAESTPITQIGAENGLLSNVLSVVDAAASGSTAVTNNLYTCQTGTAPDGLASVLTLRQGKVRAGQGLLGSFDAIFTAGVTGSQQAAGFITAENSYIFGFAGVNFGIAHAHDGISEAQELTITTPASGSEDATVTIDGIGYTVALTIGTEQHNALEISNSLNAQVPNYDFSSNDDTVVAQALLAVTTDSFAFSSSTAAAAWVQLASGLLAVIDFIPQSQWNIDNRLTGPVENKLDPTKGNVYQIQVCSNFGGVRFYVESSSPGLLVLVHVIERANLNTTPNVTHPVFRLGWLTQNLGNTSNLTISGNSASIFVEGLIKRITAPRSASNNQLAVGLTLTNIIAFRNRLHFADKPNRSEIFPLTVTGSTESNKVAFFEIVANPIFGGDVDFSYIDKENSITEIATDSVSVSGGIVIGSITIAPGSSAVINFNERIDVDFISLPSQIFSIAARISSGAAGDMQASGSWQEDL